MALTLPPPQNFGPSPQQTALGQVQAGSGINAQSQMAQQGMQNAYTPSAGVLNAARNGVIQQTNQQAFGAGQQAGLGAITQSGQQTLQGMRDFRGLEHNAEQAAFARQLQEFMNTQELQQRMREIALKRELAAHRGQSQMIGTGLQVGSTALGAYNESRSAALAAERDKIMQEYLANQYMTDNYLTGNAGVSQ